MHLEQDAGNQDLADMQQASTLVRVLFFFFCDISETNFNMQLFSAWGLVPYLHLISEEVEHH